MGFVGVGVVAVGSVGENRRADRLLWGCGRGDQGRVECSFGSCEIVSRKLDVNRQ